jgi:DNA-binding NtrC family response regulator
MTKRLLIVDDEETLTFSLYQSFIISDKDYEVITANSGEEAMEKLKSGPFDLVLTDIFMPGISGFELLKHIKGSHPNTHVVVMTAYGSDDKREQAFGLGATDYFEKPFEIKDVKKLVMNILG